MRRFVVFCLLIIGTPCSMWGQSTYGSILGTVSDTTGARVPGMTLTITNQGEDISRTTKADEVGNFEVLNLKAGIYSVKCEGAGFRSFEARDLQLVARQALRVNVALELGSVTESVSVTAGAPVVTTDTGTISTAFDSNEVLRLPANYRGAGSTSPMRILAFQPGVNADNGMDFPSRVRRLRKPSTPSMASRPSMCAATERSRKCSPQRKASRR